MKQAPLTIVTPIKPAEKKTLEARLLQIGQNIRGNDYVRFGEIETTHFARFVMIGGGQLNDRDAQTRLLFTANHDGDWQDYLDLLVDRAGAGIAAIWGNCPGYPTVPLHDPRFKPGFRRFMQAHSYPTQAFYQAYPGYSVTEVQHYLKFHEQLQTYLNQAEIEKILAVLADLPPNPAPLSWLDKFLTAVPVKKIALKAVLDLVQKLFGFQASSELPGGASVEVDTRPEVTDWLYTVQNEMSIISAIDPAQLGKLKTFLKIVNFLAQNNPTPGSLSGLTTIHFARWVIIDNGANLIFESNYDGNWEQYIGDFVDKASAGMDGIWGNCYGYPARGSQDLQAFKKTIIDHQVRAQAFYSAYPQASVRNILNDIETSRKLTRFLGQKEVAEWLRRL